MSPTSALQTIFALMCFRVFLVLTFGAKPARKLTGPVAKPKASQRPNNKIGDTVGNK